MPVGDARERILAAFKPLPGETIALSETLGRVLAANVTARMTQPPFDGSAMDGYAVRALDIETCPVELTVIGEAAAGGDISPSLKPGQAVRIFTGGVMPEGADTVVIQENVTRLDGNRIRLEKSAEKGRNIRPRGQDFREGDTLITAGTCMGPRQIGLAAAANCAEINVRRCPRVGILATGDELRPAGSALKPGQIVNSNSPAMAAFITANGGLPVDLGIAADTPEALRAAVAKAQDIDLLVTLGGASVGDHDLVQRVLGEEGLKIDFWRIAIRPGKPLIFGNFKGTPMIGLPGNPVSVIVCALVFIIPALRRMAGLTPENVPLDEAILGQALGQNDSRQHYIRASLQKNAAGQLEALPMASQDSAMLFLLAGADCLIMRAPNAPAAAAGDKVDIIPLTPRPFLV
jgi:molybdopterin molybdotransferase